MVQWCNGAMVQWCNGAMVQRCNKSETDCMTQGAKRRNSAKWKHDYKTY